MPAFSDAMVLGSGNLQQAPGAAIELQALTMLITIVFVRRLPSLSLIPDLPNLPA